MPRVHKRQKKVPDEEKYFPTLSMLITTEPDGDIKITEYRYKVSATAKSTEDATRDFWQLAAAEASVTDGDAERAQYFKDIVDQEEKFKRVLVKKEKEEDDAMEVV